MVCFITLIFTKGHFSFHIQLFPERLILDLAFVCGSQSWFSKSSQKHTEHLSHVCC